MKLFVFSLFLHLFFFSSTSAQDLPPETPIIGIFTQTWEDTPSKKSSYISSGYIKFIEMSGAQVVPIFSFSETSTILYQLSQINGVLFPGGTMQFSMDNQWTRNADAILNYAKNQNDKGNTFPVFGTCLGLQLLSYLTSDHNNSVITRVYGDDAGITHPIHMTGQPSYLYETFTPHQLQKVSIGEGIFFYSHYFSVTLDTFAENQKLNSFWRMTAWSETPNKQKFVASLQAKNYPFYALQYHPEIGLFEWNIPAVHSLEEAQVTQIMSNKFVEQARKNTNRYITYKDFLKASIYNYNTTYPSPNRLLQLYIFNEVPRMEELTE